jgi:MFS family permease
MPPAFRRVLAAPGAPRLVLSALVGRVPQTFTSLATVLLIRQYTGSFSVAGIVAGAEAVGAGAVTPFQGRLIDRLGQPRVLVPLAAGNAAGLALLAVVAVVGAPAIVLVACGLLAGACLPPLGACMRALWSALLDDGSIDAAYSIDAILTEVLFITGPVLATVVIALASPAAALGVGAALVLGGTLAFASTRASRTWHMHSPSRPAGWAISAPGMRTVVAVAVCVGTAFGALEVAVAAFARDRGSAATAGLLLAAMAAGSMVGGFWYGSREWRGGVTTRFLVAQSLLVVGFAALVLPRSLPVMAGVSFVSGFPIAPGTASLYRLVDDIAPAGMLAEAFTWLSTAVVVGAAAGSAIAGPVVQEVGIRAALAIPAAAVAAGAALALVRRTSLAPAEAMVGPG